MTTTTPAKPQTLEESFDRLAETANSVGDHLLAARRLNRLYDTALRLIRESPETNEFAKVIAACALDEAV